MSVITKEKIKTKSWTAVINYSVFDMGRECDTQEEYIEMVKDHFREEHNIELSDNEISDIEFDEVEYESLEDKYQSIGSNNADYFVQEEND